MKSPAIRTSVRMNVLWHGFYRCVRTYARRDDADRQLASEHDGSILLLYLHLRLLLHCDLLLLLL
jgi:hypothetical protein